VRAEGGTAGGSVHFVEVDVRDYGSQLGLFDAAYHAYGHVDVAISCAALGEPRGFFEPESLNLETVRQDRLDINLASVLLSSRVALAYRKGEPSPSPSPRWRASPRPRASSPTQRPSTASSG